MYWFKRARKSVERFLGVFDPIDHLLSRESDDGLKRCVRGLEFLLDGEVVADRAFDVAGDDHAARLTSQFLGGDDLLEEMSGHQRGLGIDGFLIVFGFLVAVAAECHVQLVGETQLGFGLARIIFPWLVVINAQNL